MLPPHCDLARKTYRIDIQLRTLNADPRCGRLVDNLVLAIESTDICRSASNIEPGCDRREFSSLANAKG